MDNSKGINKRAFVSCGLFLSVMGLPFSGVMNHLFANDPYTVQRHVWTSVHDVMAVLFVFFAVVHISFNWKLLAKYLKLYSMRIFSKELILASVLIIVLLFAVVIHSCGL